jgi:undecaprenyl-diphosphatase
MRFLTHLGGARATILSSLLLCVAGGRELRVGLAALFANAASHLVVQVLKRTIASARPCDPEGRALALIDLPDPFSFPSGHAAASFAVATVVAIAHPVTAPVLLALATAIAVSRVRLRVHRPVDVVAGALLGLTGAAAAARLLL